MMKRQEVEDLRASFLALLAPIQDGKVSASAVEVARLVGAIAALDAVLA